jgi:integrase
VPRRIYPIRQLPSGRWQARPAGVDPATFDTENEAVTYCARAVVNRQQGTAAPPGTFKLTFRAYAEREWLPAQDWSPATRDRILWSLETHLYPAIGDRPILTLRRDPLRKIITDLRKQNGEPLAANTVRTVLQHLNQVLNGAVANGILVRNPAQGIKAPVSDYAPVVPSKAQVQGLLDAIEPEYRAVVAVGAGLGLRQGEVFGLSRTAVDFAKGTVHIGAKVRADRQGRLHLDGTTKNKKSRTVPLPLFVAGELTNHIHTYGTSSGLIFTRLRDGGMINYRHFNDGPWRRAVVAVGLPEATFHCLRHYCATTMLRNKMSVASVAEFLGDQQATILRYYSHWIDDDLDVAREIMDAALSS